MHRAISFQGFRGVWKSLKSIGIDDLYWNFTLIYAIDAWDDFLYFVCPILSVYDLLPQRVFVWLIQNEIRWKSLIQKRVFALEDDLDLISVIFVQQFLIKWNLMVMILELILLKQVSVYSDMLYRGTVVVEDKLFVNGFQRLYIER